MRKKIIIFGATGNTGSYLVDYALNFFDKNEFEVIASGRRKTDFFSKRGVPYYSVDLTKEEDFASLPTNNVYAIMLLAAEIPSYMTDYQPKKYLDSIVMGGYNVLEYCRKNHVDRIIFTQTVFDISLYSRDMLLKPDLAPNFSYTGDHAIYVIAKNCMLELLEHYYQEYGLKKFIFRLPTIYNYSPFHYFYPNSKKTLRPIYSLIDKAMNSEPIEIWGDPQYKTDMVYVDDFSQMLCRAVLVDRSAGFYNVGTGMPVALEDKIRTLIDVFSPKDNPSPITYCPEKRAGGGRIMDITNAKEELGYEPKFSCRDIFEKFKEEMKINRFAELRMK